MRFLDFAALCGALEETRGRLEKRRLVTEYLTAVPDAELPHAVAFLSGRPFAVSDPRTLGVRGLPTGPLQNSGPPLDLTDVAAAFAEIAEASGGGARARREARLAELATRASPVEREYLRSEERRVGKECRL